MKQTLLILSFIFIGGNLFAQKHAQKKVRELPPMDTTITVVPDLWLTTVSSFELLIYLGQTTQSKVEDAGFYYQVKNSSTKTKKAGTPTYAGYDPLALYSCSIKGLTAATTYTITPYYKLYGKGEIKATPFNATTGYNCAWDYSNTSRWPVCAPPCGGTSQSPIEIDTALAVEYDGPNLFTFNYNNFYPVLKDDGHSLQLQCNEKNNFITFNGASFAFQQIHLHAHSEHKIKGLPYFPMEAHMVHMDTSTGQTLVLSYLVEEVASTTNELDTIFSLWPTQKNVNNKLGFKINLSQIVPTTKIRDAYIYDGSLTTPPCNQGVRFVVLTNRLQLTKAMIKKFTTHYDHNFRPTQPLNGREVYKYHLHTN